jgi:hypothetical protein
MMMKPHLQIVAKVTYYWMSEMVMSGMLVTFVGHIDLKLIAFGTLLLGYLMKRYNYS